MRTIDRRSRDTTRKTAAKQGDRALAGLTLTEALLALSVAAIAITGSMSLLNQGTASHNQQQLQRQVLDIANGIDALYSARPTFDGLDTAGVVAAQIATATAGGVIETPWQDDIRIVAGGAVATIEFALPPDQCRRLLSSAITQHPLIDSVSVSGSSPVTMPMDPSAIGSDCDNSETPFAVSATMRKP